MCIYSSLFTVNGSNNTVQLNNEEKKQQRNAIGTQYTQNSLAYKHFTITSTCIISLDGPAAERGCNDVRVMIRYGLHVVGHIWRIV